MTRECFLCNEKASYTLDMTGKPLCDRHAIRAYHVKGCDVSKIEEVVGA